jgi:hypothetical protein
LLVRDLNASTLRSELLMIESYGGKIKEENARRSLANSA